jgi:hypothetical protein
MRTLIEKGGKRRFELINLEAIWFALEDQETLIWVDLCLSRSADHRHI